MKLLMEKKMRKVLSFVFIFVFLYSCTTTQKVSEEDQGLLTDAEKEFITSMGEKDIPVVKNDTKEGDAVLRKVSKKTLMGSDGYDVLEKKMMKALEEEKGVGIAAPQIGVNRRLVIVQRLDKELKPFEFYYNPVILEMKGEMIEGWEGCLSIPAGFGKVKRQHDITIEYDVMTDGKVTRKQEHIVGFVAVIFQHELDHLEGVLFIDKKCKGPLVPKDKYREMREKEKEQKEKEQKELEAKKATEEESKKEGENIESEKTPEIPESEPAKIEKE